MMTTMRSWFRYRLPVIAVCIASYTLAVVFLERSSPGVSGQTSTYSYSTEELGDGSYLAIVRIVDQSYDFTSYKVENDARIDAWSSSPTTAPMINDRSVLLTFTAPMSYLAVVQLVSPYASTTGMTPNNVPPWLYHLAGRTSAGNEVVFMKSLFDFDPDIIGVPQWPPVEVCQASPYNCESTTYSGIIAVEFDVAGGAASLQALKNNALVFLVDTTGIELRHQIAQSNPAIASNLQEVSLPEPEQDDTHGHVTIP